MFFSTKTILLFLVFCDIIISFTMAESKQERSLTHLLDGLEKAHRADVQLYTSGHLNHNNLYKPRENVKPGYWDSAKKPASFMTARKQLTAQNICKETAKKMKNSLPDFTPSTTLVPVLAKSASSIYRHSQTLMASVDHPVNGPLTSTPLEKQLKELKKKIEEETDRLKKPLKREELDVPEMKVLKYKPVKNSRRCAAEVAKDEYQFMPSYLAGVTKTDQFNKFLHFQRDFIAKHDLLENDIIGSKASERHERKLAQELQKICDCNRPHFKRLQVFGDVFEDICNSSLIFGDILKEVKVRDTSQAYQITLWQHCAINHACLFIVPETSGDHAMKLPEEKHLSLAEQIESMRCQVLAKWEEMQAIEKEIRETMTHAGMANTIEKTVKDIEAEALKLNSANNFLQHQIKVSSFFRTVIWSKAPLETCLLQLSSLSLIQSLLKSLERLPLATVGSA
uniref:Chromosome 6 open reading frame 118 n=1 Tax=Chelonoidis abingdonii TaxID=106734 RepID=A0A8C0J7Y4_CHEAB